VEPQEHAMVIRARARELTDALEAASMAGLAVTCDLGPKHVTYAEDGSGPVRRNWQARVTIAKTVAF
jgi:hypothetical protein